ncbi:MAG TPA: hypothetical protein VK582_06535 [Pyrinomonadaceae bacterium]|nr:hypothetical protein [Pyrinomonadaceae bacterium]
MKYQLGSLRDLHPAILVARLADGWTARHRDIAKEFLRRWERNLDSKVGSVELGVNTALFIQDLSYITFGACTKYYVLFLAAPLSIKRQLTSSGGN